MGAVIPCPYHLVHAKQIRQRKQHRQLVVVLAQPLEPRLHKAKLTFDDPKRVLHFGADAGFEPLKGNHSLVFSRMLVELLEPLVASHSQSPIGALTSASSSRFSAPLISLRQRTQMPPRHGADFPLD